MTSRGVGIIFPEHMSVAQELALQSLVKRSQETSLHKIMLQESIKGLDDLGLGRLFLYGANRKTGEYLGYSLSLTLDRSQQLVLTTGGSIMALESAGLGVHKRSFDLTFGPTHIPYEMATKDQEQIYRFFLSGAGVGAEVLLDSRNISDMQRIRELMPQAVSVSKEIKAQGAALVTESTGLIFNAAALAREQA